MFRPGKTVGTRSAGRGLEHGFIQGKGSDSTAAATDENATLAARRIEEKAAHFVRQVDGSQQTGGVEQSEGARNGGRIAVAAKFSVARQRFPGDGRQDGGEAFQETRARRREAQSQFMATRQRPRQAGFRLRMRRGRRRQRAGRRRVGTGRRWREAGCRGTSHFTSSIFLAVNCIWPSFSTWTAFWHFLVSFISRSSGRIGRLPMTGRPPHSTRHWS